VTSNKRQPRLFWKFGADFHGEEAVRHDATDFIVFSVMGVLCVWSIVSMASAILRVFLG
jgi:hypothetical protein